MSYTDGNRVEVSIICNTYNHEMYLRDALEGFISQNTTFDYEVLIHDDASTDKTREIIEEYQHKFPEIIKPIYQNENKYSKGIRISNEYQYPRIRGRYVALCEGDDYWTDPFKLQRQYDMMELHPEIDICAHSVSRTKDEKFIKNIEYSMSDTIFTLEQVILYGGDFVATCSLFFRSELCVNMVEFWRKYSYDYAIQIAGALSGGMLYLSDRMGVYRVLSNGSWNNRMRKDDDKLLKHYYCMIDMLDMVNEETKETCVDVIEFKKLDYLYKIHELNSSREELRTVRQKLLNKKYKRFYSMFDTDYRLKTFLKYKYPWLLKLQKYIRGY